MTPSTRTHGSYPLHPLRRLLLQSVAVVRQIRINAARFALLTVWGMVVAVARADEVPNAIAVVDHIPIPIERFATAIKETGVLLASLDADDRERLKREILNEVIEQELLLREAKSRGLVPSDAELAREIARARAQTDPKELASILEERGITASEWEQRLRDNLIVSKVMATLSRAVSEPAEAEIRAYYDSHPEEFVEPEAVETSQIVVATEAEAMTLHEQLFKGASFAELATAHSTAPEAADGGRLGLVRKGQVPESFDIIFTLKPGDISPVVHTPYGYHIFTVSARRPATRLAYAEAAPVLREQLGRTRREDAAASWIRERVSHAEIVINEPLLKQFDGRPLAR